ncbi:MAG: amidohydrolase [Candidatus Lindowbacteria bacterium]|nr:amidohydrolase [Candidatus Lindowbacteria bacterium]
MKERIRQEATKLFDWLVETRRDIHAHPEIGMQEVRTSAKIADELRRIGLEVRTGIGMTGVTGLLRGGAPGRTIGIRADMDALPIEEETGLPFASQNKGVMHACGHDGHVAMALGTAVFMVSINGKGGHGSEPQACVDPIHIAAHVITAVQTMIPRTLDAQDPVVVSVCSIQGGSAFNVIPDCVHFGGTVRTLSRERRAVMPKKLEEIVRGITATFGATFDFSYIHGAPITANEPGMTDLMRGVAAELWGAGGVVEMDKPHMGSEDYSYYLEKVPGAMGMLGARRDREVEYPSHHPKYDFDDRCLPLGVELLAASAVKYLNGTI